ncbi:MAG: Inner rane component of cytoplasmic domain [Bacteroidota bacterium]|jgi:pSer/pThr/pTyr-binding forkhead associated (FHA) protein
MFAKRYIKIGAAAANDIQFTDPELLPYHAILLQDSNGAVYFHLCVAEARAILNGTPVEQLAELHADDHLQIGTTNLAIKDLFDWPVQVTTDTNNATDSDTGLESSSKRGLSLQLVVIYAAVALLLILMAFYV